MQLGYNTNGWAHHELLDAIDLLAEIGFRSVAITLDHHALNPYAEDVQQNVEAVRQRLKRHSLSSVIETGARYLLDRRVKHEPTLVSPLADDRARRVDFLCRAIDIAELLGSDCVSFWSGVVRDGASDAEVWKRLIDGTRRVVDYAASRKVVLGFEPEPGMFIDTMQRLDEFLRGVNAPALAVTLDVGHLHCQGEIPIADQILRWGSRLVNVHIEDMRAGVHEHLMFGEGEMDFPPIFAALKSVGYAGGVHVELSRHSHAAPAAAMRAFSFLKALECGD